MKTLTGALAMLIVLSGCTAVRVTHISPGDEPGEIQIDIEAGRGVPPSLNGSGESARPPDSIRGISGSRGRESRAKEIGAPVSARIQSPRASRTTIFVEIPVVRFRPGRTLEKALVDWGFDRRPYFRDCLFSCGPGRDHPYRSPRVAIRAGLVYALSST